MVSTVPNGLTIDVFLAGGPGFANEILMNAFRRQGRIAGVGLRAKFVRRASVAELKEALLDTVAKGSSGVIVQAIEHRTIRDCVLELGQVGIPVVCALTALPGVETLGYAGLDNRAAGRTAGLLLGHLARRHGKVAIFYSDALYRSHEERESGVRNALRQDFPDISVLDSISTVDNPDRCYAEAIDLLTRHPDLGGLCNLGGGNRGIEKALIETGRASDVAYVAFNLTPLTRKALMDGTIDAVVHQDMNRIAASAIEMIGRHHAQQPINFRYVPTEIIMRENIRDIDAQD